MSKMLTVRDPNQISIWTERISQRESSGKAVTAWCAENGIGVKAYYYWHNKIMKLADEYDQTSTGRFCDISGNRVFTSGTVAADIHIGGDRAEIYNGADESTVAAIIKAMKSC